jgi:hypothetical protein
MRTHSLLVILSVIAVLFCSPAAFAWGGHHGGGHFGFYFGGPAWGWGGPYYGGYYSPFYGGYNPYYAAPPAIMGVPGVPQTYVQQTPAPSANTQINADYWYYCDNPTGYYPYVKECLSNWQPVSPSPPPAR